MGQSRAINLNDPNGIGGGSVTNMGDNLPAVNLGTGLTAKKIATGTNHVCAILNNDKVKCWGDSFNYETGSYGYSGNSASNMVSFNVFITFFNQILTGR